MSTKAARTALSDQIGAAHRDARELLRDFAALLGERHTVDHTSPGPFATALIEGLDERMRRHRQRKCPHLRRGPQMVWLFGWMPERLYCERCAHKLLAQVNGTVENSTCDVCRAVADPCNPVMGSAGPMIVLFGACDPCYDRERGVAA
jgi:hypothetical protein